MCNLSQGIRDDGIAIGEARFILSMYEKGYTLEQIADVAGKNIEKREPVLA